MMISGDEQRIVGVLAKLRPEDQRSNRNIRDEISRVASVLVQTWMRTTVIDHHRVHRELRLQMKVK